MIFKNMFRVNKKLFRYLNYDVIIVCVILVVFGTINIYNDTKGGFGTYYAKLQLIWLVLGLGVIGAILLVDYVMVCNYAPLIYWASVILLVLNNNFLGSNINGARGWIKLGSRAIQPSEFAKLALIIMLSKKINDMEGDINNFKNFMIICIYTAIPMVLILVQPDMGMTMVTFFTVLGLLFIAGLHWKIIAGGLTGIAVIIIGIWNSPLMKPYWKGRLLSFINPKVYANNYGYQAMQAVTGIGAGGVLGRGFGNGSQYASVPESHTDFIFAVIGEEWGLFGALLLLVLYGYIIVRFLQISGNARDTFGKLLCAGLASSFLFSIFQNIGMTIQIMPVTGITLPLVSYGGSSMLSNFIGIGLILNIGMRRKRINFY